MNKYHIQWTELHEAQVEARHEEEAYEVARELDYEITLQSSTVSKIELLGGYCREHGVDYAGDGGCPECQYEPEIGEDR